VPSKSVENRSHVQNRSIGPKGETPWYDGVAILTDLTCLDAECSPATGFKLNPQGLRPQGLKVEVLKFFSGSISVSEATCRTLQFSESAMAKDRAGPQASGSEFDEQPYSRIQNDFTHCGDANWAINHFVSSRGPLASKLPASHVVLPPPSWAILQNARRPHFEGVISRWNFCRGLYLRQRVFRPEAWVIALMTIIISTSHMWYLFPVSSLLF
jgi:hypothetical protein